MDCTRRFFGAAVASVGVLAFARVAFAKHQHLPAHQLLGNNINTDGKHEIHKRGDHTIYAHVKGKKISHISVTHKTKGEVLVKKYKTNKKSHFSPSTFGNVMERRLEKGLRRGTLIEAGS